MRAEVKPTTREGTGSVFSTETCVILRHFLAALGYRAGKAIRGAPENFGEFCPGHGIRKPVEIVAHMSAVLMHGLSFLGGPQPARFANGTWEEEVRRFYAILEALDRSFASGAKPDGRTEEQLLQGPLADAMTHVGQLAMLRRMAGSPLPKEDFDEADIRPGDLLPPY